MSMLIRENKQQLLEKFKNFLIDEAVYEYRHHNGQILSVFENDYDTLCSIIDDYGGIGYLSFNDAFCDALLAAKQKGGNNE